MTKPRATHCGKQIMLDGCHLADAASTNAARVIAICLNIRADRMFVTSDDDRALLKDFFG